MKVLLIHPRFAKLGGLEQRLINYADYFLSHQSEVHIACRRFEKQLVKPGINIHRFQPLLFNSTNKNLLFNQKLEKWDKPHFDFELSLGRTTIQKNILAPATHLGFMNGIQKNKKTKADELYIEMDRIGYQSSEFIWAASQMVKEEIIRFYGINNDKIHVLYPPFDPNKHLAFTSEEKKQLRRKHQLPADKIYHLFVSSSHQLKGIDLLTKVFQKLKDSSHVLLVIGEKFTPSSPNIISLGYYDNIRMAYALGDYLLHPSQYDAFAQVVTEALHHQIPAIVSDNTGAKEILTEETGVIIKERDVDAWIETISSLPEKKFNIPKNIIFQLGLDINSHVQQMMRINNVSL